MYLHSETPALTGSNVRIGASVDVKAVAAQNYLNAPIDVQRFAALVVAKRYGLSPAMARLVCELAHLGGRSK
ncbi:hypothetical protein ACWGS9_13810 [Bradyrhizobium sp. Arg314]